MSNLNKVQIIGRNGRDPEIRYMNDGKAVASLAVAVSEKWKDKQGQPQESTEWFNVSMFGRLAEIAGEYVKKGDLIYLEGKQKTDKWQDQSGQDKYTTKLIANQMQMLSSKPQGQQQGQYTAPNGQPMNPQQVKQQQAGSQVQQNGKQNNAMTEPDFDFDDTIPF